MSLKDLHINKEWTLFLDRDGVINDRLINDYVKQLNELRIIDGVPQAISTFSRIFNRVLVVTNQQGIGKGLMTADDLEIIHGYMNNIFNDHGGKIDQFYFAPQLASEGSDYRKPGSGMAIAAKADFPDIDFSKSLMIGDSESDIEFGMNLGMKTVMLTTVSNISTKADYIFNNLQAVARELEKSIE
ncbi:MAG: HAD-IIIA family hydrolase [Crocinitomicaceae bacterium]|nr:HAD-IIIA family hydrolase [Crocinitomicaceae bacterium]